MAMFATEMVTDAASTYLTAAATPQPPAVTDEPPPAAARPKPSLPELQLPARALTSREQQEAEEQEKLYHWLQGVHPLVRESWKASYYAQRQQF